MESTKKTYQGLRLLLSISPFSPCDSRRYDVYYNSTTTNTLQYYSPIRFPFPFSFRYFSYGLRSSSVLLDLEFLSPNITFFTFPYHLHRQSSPYQALYLIAIPSSCILYPISGIYYCYMLPLYNSELREEHATSYNFACLVL